MRKSQILGAAVAVVVALSVSGLAMANSQKADFNLEGFVGFVGLSQDPANPTTVESDFTFNSYGVPTSVVVKTNNEMVLGALGQLRDCDGDACETLAAALSGAPLTSLHDSTAELTVTDHDFLKYTLPTPFGDMPLVAQAISGDIEGQLKGTVQLPTSHDVLLGETDLGIAGSATYVCFSPFLAALGVPDPLPGPLHPCAIGLGQLLPIELDIVDTGKINVQKQVIQEPGGPKIVGSDIIIDGGLIVDLETSIDLNLLVRGDPAALTVDGDLRIFDATGEVVVD